MIHKFEQSGTKIVLDVNSGAVHVFDDLAWEILDDFLDLSRADLVRKYALTYPVNEVEEVLDELDRLCTQGLLFSDDCFSAQELAAKRAPVVKSLCLNIAHDCNLRCSYCFAGSGHFGGQRTLMSVETGKLAVDFLLAQSGNRRHLEIDFFGGEPLMNFDTVKELVAYGKEASAQRGKEIKFTLTTNASLLNKEITDFLNKESISVVLSLDGRPEVNDHMRKLGNGTTGSYACVEPRISSFIASRDNENYVVRGTYTHQNLDFSEDALYLADLGYKYISVEPVVGPLSENWALQMEDLPVLFEEYEKLVKGYLKRIEQGKPFDFFHFNLNLNNGPCLPKRLSGCGAGYEYLAVTPEGDFYPCHQFVGREHYKLGNVHTGINNPEEAVRFSEAHVYNKGKCRDCWAKFHCGGGCHANAESTNGTIMEPYQVGCELEKKRLECAIYIQVLG